MNNNTKIGFIGGGALTESLLAGIADKLLPAKNIFVSDHKTSRAEFLHNKYGIDAAVGAGKFLPSVDVLFFAVKPKDALSAMRDNAAANHKTLIVSVMAGISLNDIERIFSANPCVRVMPNTPQAVGAGMAAYALGKNAVAKHAAVIEEIFGAVGRTTAVTENLLDAATGLSGSGPAFMFLAIDALTDGGVAAGLPRQTALTMAAQTMLGAAKMVLDTNKHPDILRDQVTSPGGTTIAGVRALEAHGFRSALIEAVLAATAKSREMSGKSS